MESPDRQDFITAIKELGISDSEVCKKRCTEIPTFPLFVDYKGNK